MVDWDLTKTALSFDTNPLLLVVGGTSLEEISLAGALICFVAVVFKPW